MNEPIKVDYGPLTGLIGVWKGDKGMDVSPEPDGEEHTSYFETITFEAIGTVTNAESQTLAALHYRQVVRRKSNGEGIHDETGYWMWDAKNNVVMHSLVIPRGVGVLAGGIYQPSSENEKVVTLKVEAKQDHPSWNIIQSPFMQEKARTREFHHTVEVGQGKLSYSETMVLDIYGRVFQHTDQNELTLEET
jgi:hypothetical protein